MPHGLEQLPTGEYAYAGARVPAWHRLGVTTESAMTAADALRLAHLGGWNVTKRPLLSTDPNGMPVPVPEKFATVRRRVDASTGRRTYDALGVVGDQYQVIQNEEAFDFLTSVVEAGDASFETAGALKGGSKVFVTMRLSQPVRVAEGDELALFVGVSTTHDGSETLMAFPTPVRVVCQNTLSQAVKGNKQTLRVRHDRGAKGALERAREVLSATLRHGEALAAAGQEMLKVPVSEADFDRTVAEQFLPLGPSDSRQRRERRVAARERLAYYFRHAATQESGRGTAWGAYNAIAEWTEWDRAQAGPSTGQATLFGKVAETRQLAFDIFGPADGLRAA